MINDVVREVAVARRRARTSNPVIAAGCLALLAGACEKPPVEEAPVARPVKILTVGENAAAERREYPGTIKARQHADMAFEVPGKIEEFLVKEGEFAREGDLLARLDDRDYQAELAKAQANHRKALADLKRGESIYKEDPGAISTEAIESYRRAVGVTKAALAQAQKAVEDTRLRAPFSGYVARKLVADFQNVQAKEPVLVLQDLSRLEIVVSVPERDLTRGATRLTPAELTRQANPTVTVSALPGRQFPARIKEFATTADPVTRTFQATLAFDNPKDVSILPGMTARISVDPPASDQIWIPAHAVRADNEAEPYVWLVDPQKMTVSRRVVTVGQMAGEDIRVESGLEAGEQIAVSGVKQLQEGMEVRRYQRRSG